MSLSRGVKEGGSAGAGAAVSATPLAEDGNRLTARSRVVMAVRSVARIAACPASRAASQLSPAR